MKHHRGTIAGIALMALGTWLMFDAPYADRIARIATFVHSWPVIQLADYDPPR